MDADDVATCIEDEHLNPWKAVIIDELICDHILTKKHLVDPKYALTSAIQWNVDVALDPAVSQDARVLQTKIIERTIAHIEHNKSMSRIQILEHLRMVLAHLR